MPVQPGPSLYLPSIISNAREEVRSSLITVSNRCEQNQAKAEENDVKLESDSISPETRA